METVFRLDKRLRDLESVNPVKGILLHFATGNSSALVLNRREQFELLFHCMALRSENTPRNVDSRVDQLYTLLKRAVSVTPQDRGPVSIAWRICHQRSDAPPDGLVRESIESQ